MRRISHFVSQAKSKELELLCSLKNVEFDPIEQEKSVGKLMWVEEYDQDRHFDIPVLDFKDKEKIKEDR